MLHYQVYSFTYEVVCEAVLKKAGLWHLFGLQQFFVDLNNDVAEVAALVDNLGPMGLVFEQFEADFQVKPVKLVVVDPFL